MGGGNGGDGNFVEGIGGLPPIHFLNLREARDAWRGEAGADAERGGKNGAPAGGDAAQGGKVEMIVVVVTLEHEINGGKLVEMNSGGAVARRSDPGEGAGAMGPDGIAENVEAFELDEDRGMTDEGGADFSVVNAFGRSGAGRRVNPFAPGCGAASEQPFERASAAVHGGDTRIEKMLAVEMVGDRSVVEWH